MERLERSAASRNARVAISDIATSEFTHYQVAVSPTGVRYDEYARAVHEACLEKTAANLTRSYEDCAKQICAACVYSTAMPGIYLHSDGRCNMCHAYEEALSRNKLQGGLERELAECLAPGPQDADFDVIVALSGGKDSSAALAFAASEKNLRVTAVLADNGFIPNFVKKNCQSMCDRVGAEFVILDFDFRDDVKRALATSDPSIYPCIVCTKQFKQLISEYAVRHNCKRVIMGRNFWATIEPELSGARELRAFNGQSVFWYSLPFLLGWKIQDLKPRLEKVGWDQRAKDIPGASTNCMVPGIVEEHFKNSTGLHPEAPLLANEIICGFITQKEGLDEIAGHD